MSQSQRIVGLCAWCGEMIDDQGLEQNLDAMRKHSMSCSKNPARETERQLAQARAEMAQECRDWVRAWFALPEEDREGCHHSMKDPNQDDHSACAQTLGLILQEGVAAHTKEIARLRRGVLRIAENVRSRHKTALALTSETMRPKPEYLAALDECAIFAEAEAERILGEVE